MCLKHVRSFYVYVFHFQQISPTTHCWTVQDRKWTLHHEVSCSTFLTKEHKEKWKKLREMKTDIRRESESRNSFFFPLTNTHIIHREMECFCMFCIVDLFPFFWEGEKERQGTIRNIFHLLDITYGDWGLWHWLTFSLHTLCHVRKRVCDSNGYDSWECLGKVESWEKDVMTHSRITSFTSTRDFERVRKRSGSRFDMFVFQMFNVCSIFLS